jgi:predicted ATPase/serine/threonine protein kinase
MALTPGEHIGGYRVERLLARGGMGEVYLASDEALGRRVALKLLPAELADNPAFRRRFLVESRLAASLDHPHIVPIYEAGETDGRLFIAMRYVEGDDLGTLIGRDGPLSPERALGLLRGVADALDAAHDRGLVHRDVKPGNILVAPTARGGEHAYLADFGLVKQLGSGADFTQSGQLLGSLDYIAPEQIEGRPIDGRADVYSLACVLYEALTGHPPFPGERDVATLWAHLQAARPRPSDIRPDLAPLDPVIARGMAVDPAERYPSAGELVGAARHVLDDGTGLRSSTSEPTTAGSQPLGLQIPARDENVRSDVARVPTANNLPSFPTSLVGRQDEVAELVDLLRGPARLITLTGPGGTGKTRLAVAAAERIVDHYVHGAYFVDLSPIYDLDLAWSSIAQAVGATGGLDARIGHGTVLLVLDNLEQIASFGEKLASLLAACSNLDVLATSRAPLHIGAEHEYAVAPLPAHDAVELFIERAKASDRTFTQDEAVAEICSRLDGLPLAIELAAARIKVLSSAAILRNLDRALPMLTGGPLDAPARHQTLSATIAWSCDLLAPAEISLFRRLAVFAGGSSLEAALSVCEAGLDEITALVDHSLLRRRDDRFVMLETIREFATDLLVKSGDEASTRARHARYFREMLAESSVLSANSGPFRLMVEETDNLRAALTFLTEQPSTDDALDIALALWPTWIGQGRVAEGDEWFTRALARSDPTETKRREDALSAAGEFPRFRGDWARAEHLKLQALAMARRLDLPQQVAADLTDLGSMAVLQGDLRLARERLEEALAIRRSLGLPHGLAHALAGIAELDLREGTPAAATEHLEEAVGILRLQGLAAPASLDLGVQSLLHLAEARRQFGDLDRAADLLIEGLQLATEVGLVDAARTGFEVTAGVLVARGRADRAAVMLGAAARLLKETGFVDDFAQERAPIEASARASLGDETYRRVWLKGSAMELTEAINLAVISLRDDEQVTIMTKAGPG